MEKDVIKEKLADLRNKRLIGMIGFAIASFLLYSVMRAQETEGEKLFIAGFWLICVIVWIVGMAYHESQIKKYTKQLEDKF